MLTIKKLVHALELIAHTAKTALQMRPRKLKRRWTRRRPSPSPWRSKANPNSTTASMESWSASRRSRGPTHCYFQRWDQHHSIGTQAQCTRGSCMDLPVEHVDIWAASIQDKPGALATVLAELRESGADAIHHCAACAGGARQGRRVRHAAAGRQGNRCGGTIGLQRHAHSPFRSSHGARPAWHRRVTDSEAC